MKTYHIGKQMTIEELYANEILQKNDWKELSKIGNLSEEIIEEFKYKLDWRLISIYRDLNINFIEKYKDLLDWKEISKYQSLSESDIEYFEDYVDWDFIGAKQKISFKFILKHWNKFDVYGLRTNSYLKKYNSKEFVLKLIILYINCRRLFYKGEWA
jgi:ribosomal protein S13